MITTIEEFKNEWQAESDFTRKVLTCLTDESLKESETDSHRTIARLVWHIISFIPRLASFTGLNVPGPSPETPIPYSVETIKQTYDSAAKAFLQEVLNHWTDETLNVEDFMFTDKWKRSKSLTSLIKHEIHHRGQLTILMRQAGLNVPGVYGPAKEDWARMGMQAPKV